MKSIKKTLLLLSSIAIAISNHSCKKDTNNGTVTVHDGKELANVLKSNAPTFQTFNINASSGGTLTTAFGTKFKFPANVFLNSDGSIATGTITISIKEIQDVSAMILADKQTLTNDGKILESYGEFFVAAQQDNKKLVIRKDTAGGGGVLVQIPRRPAAGLKEIPVWDGDSAISVTKSGYDYQNNAKTISDLYYVKKGIDWKQNTSTYAFFNGVDNTIDFRLDSLFKWTNCDALFNNGSPKTTVMAYMGNLFNSETKGNFQGDDPSMLYFKPKGINSIIKLYNIILEAPEAFQGFHSYQNSIPVGMEGTFLAMSSKKGKFYAETKTVTIANPGSATYVPLSFNLQEVSSNQLLSLIADMKSK